MTVKVCLPREETYIVPPACSLAAAVVFGINKMTLSYPARSSATTVVAAFAVNVTVPVEFNLPAKILLTTRLISRGSIASLGNRLKLAPAKLTPLYVNALRVLPISVDGHLRAMEPALHAMLTKTFVC